MTGRGIDVDRSARHRGLAASDGHSSAMLSRLPQGGRNQDWPRSRGGVTRLGSVGAGGVLGAPAGVSAVQMFGTDTRYYGQFPTDGSPGPIPAAVCVQDYTARDVNGQAIPSFVQKAVTDQVAVLQAQYDPATGGSITVSAWSSDQ